MNEKEKFDRFVNRWPHPHKTFFDRPHYTRRRFFEVAGAGLVGSYLLDNALLNKANAQTCTSPTQIITQQATPHGTAKNCIFILLAGAPSHTDMFDLKVVNGTTPSNFSPTTMNGVSWPVGLLPKIGSHLGDIAIVRSMQAWALVHLLAQHWTQIGRNPAAALGDIAPNIGSVVAIEKANERQAGQVFPTFVSLNSPIAVGSGYLAATYAPFNVTPSTTGVPDTTNSLGQVRFNSMYNELHEFDKSLRVNSPLGKPVSDYDNFYTAAQQVMYNPAVDKAFGFSSADSVRYGGNTFGNACLVAKQILAADQGTRFIQITFGSWDMHQDIYGKQNPKGNNLYTMGTPLDNGVGALLDDLKSSGLLEETLVVMVGEFGRTVGQVTAAGGRDHWLQQSVVFAGGGVKGGKVLGATDPTGADTVDFGWSRQRYVHPEDVEATIYSALGIDWTTVRCDDPFMRGFEYVPFSDQNLCGPIDELWQ
jgi:hypothetical protein